jgi:hypothetical protein
LKCHFFSHQTSLSHHVCLVHHHGGNRLINRRRTPQRPHTQPWLWMDSVRSQTAWLAGHFSSVRRVVPNVTVLKCDLLSWLGSLCTVVTLSITTMAITIQAGARPQRGPSAADGKANEHTPIVSEHPECLPPYHREIIARLQKRWRSPPCGVRGKKQVGAMRGSLNFLMHEPSP